MNDKDFKHCEHLLIKINQKYERLEEKITNKVYNGINLRNNY